MRNEKEYSNQCKKFLHNHDFVHFFKKTDGAFLVYNVLDNIVCLYSIDFYKNFIVSSLI